MTHEGQSEKVPRHVLPASGQPLFGRNWLRKIKLNWSLFKLENAVDDLVKEVLQRHEAVFSPELGQLKSIKAKIAVKAGSTPRCIKARSVPLSRRA